MSEDKALVEQINKSVGEIRSEVGASVEAQARMEANLATLLTAKTASDAAAAASEARISALEAAGEFPGVTKTEKADMVMKTEFFAGLRKNDFSSYVQKSVNTTTPVTGGAIVPEYLNRNIMVQAGAYSPLRSLARIEFSTTDNYNEAVLLDTMGAGWTGELGSRPLTADLSFKKIVPNGGEIYSYALVSEWQLADSITSVENLIVDAASRKAGAIEANGFWNGTGLNDTPLGILNDTTVTKTASAATDDAEIIDELIDLRYAMNPYYVANSAFVGDATRIAKLVKAKSSDGSYLYMTSVAAGQPDTFLGRPIYADATVQNAIAFADWMSFFVIVDIHGTIVRPDFVTQPGFCKIRVARRVKGGVTDHAAGKVLTFA